MRVVALAFLAVAGIVWLTCATVTETPQLEPDDYRYLSLVQGIESGIGPGLPEAFVVENRWDHLWFTETDAVVRFFRPTVVASFWADGRLWPRGATGYLATNVLLHGACCLLATWILVALLGPGLPAVLAAVLFAAFAAHAETIWYVAGRTDTLAALGFLGALCCHVHGSGRRRLRWLRWLRWLGLPCYAFAIFSKELTAMLPVVLVLHDRWVVRREPTLRALARRDAALWLSYGAIVAGFAAVRTVMLGGATGSDLVPPYFFSPLSAAFPPHLLVQLRSYAGNLFAAELTAPFATGARVLADATLLGWVAATAAPVAAFVRLRRDPRFALFAVLAVLTWIPACFVYVSERYLYLPSFGVAGIAGLALAEASRRRPARWILVAVLLAWAGHQGIVLHAKNRHVSHVPREGYAVLDRLLALGPPLPRGADVLLVNFPSEVIHAQFVEDQLRFYYRDPSLRARVLTLMPARSALPRTPDVRRAGRRALRIAAPGNLMARAKLFRWIDFATGTRVERPRLGFGVRILDGAGPVCRALRIDLDEPVEHYVILRFVRGPAELDAKPTGWQILGGRFERVHP